MAWSTPPTFVAGATLTASQLNILTGDLAVIGGAWTSYTPTLTNITLGNGTLVAKYKQVGDKTFIVKGRFGAGSTSSYSAGNLGWSLPFTPHADYTGASNDWAVGSAIIEPISNRVGGTVIITTAGIFNFLVDNLTSAAVATNLVPATWGTGAVLSFTTEPIEAA